MVAGLWLKIEDYLIFCIPLNCEISERIFVANANLSLFVLPNSCEFKVFLLFLQTIDLVEATQTL